MHPKHLKTLELDKILERLAGYASFSASKELILAQQPETAVARVRAMLAATSEARKLLAGRPQLSVGAAKDIRPLVKRASLGAILSPAEFLDVLDTIESARSIRDLLHRAQLVYPQLALFAGRLHALPQLRKDIVETINDHAEVLDDASPQLARLRTEVRAGRERILRRLDAIITDPNNAEAIQEPIVTERNGRYVIAVKAGYRHHIRGVVHDQSESGATLFVEPLATVDTTNEWRQRQLEEQREVERILRILSRRVSHEAAQLDDSVEALAGIDATIARARYAEALAATEPEIDEQGRLVLMDARHPLLQGEVVPQTLRLGDEFLILVITGPNTGGKTVALKTVGLLTLMAQCGMHIPAAGGSAVTVFDEVLADIGDEQSIEQSLSTFSAHMRNIVSILRTAGERTLVLLDELGAGTDPTEGSALAQAILNHLLEQRVPTIATTHFSELKTFAHNRAGIENASVEFDVLTLSPTYRVLIGTPGRSNALAIAARLGLPDSILTDARSGLPQEHLRVESLLEGITRKEREAARERNRATRQQQQLRRLRAEANGALEEAERLREEARGRAYDEAAEELSALRREAARLAQQLERQRTDRDAVRSVQANLATLSQQLEVMQPRPATEAAAPGRLRVGQTVQVPSFSEPGQVLTEPDGRGEVDVQVGAFRVHVPASEVRAASKQRRLDRRVTFTAAPRRPERAHTLANPLDLRGLRADEIEPLLDRELNDAFVGGIPYVKIVHGHGSGVVKQIVRDYLAHQPYVSSYEPAPPNEGGDGATLVTLAL
ncbi:MAG: endonuclease MutS2 [Chloroflexota bacterium]|nr:endonuclease MutS2 [Chloroflexota bacterium]